jgi:uncharacterized membrane protein YphA (DoxX/SURF4 family)
MSMQSVTASSHPTLSYTDSLAASTSDTLLLIARILMGWIFVRSGLGKLMDINAFIATMPPAGCQDGSAMWPRRWSSSAGSH